MDKIRVITICFLYFLIKSGVNKPILVRKYTNIGNSKIKPFAKLIVVTVDTNELKPIVLET